MYAFGAFCFSTGNFSPETALDSQHCFHFFTVSSFDKIGGLFPCASIFFCIVIIVMPRLWIIFFHPSLMAMRSAMRRSEGRKSAKLQKMGSFYF